jgi:hypothetical protein
MFKQDSPKNQDVELMLTDSNKGTTITHGKSSTRPGKFAIKSSWLPLAIPPAIDFARIIAAHQTA